MRQIAIDGPAGSGKSTIAKILAKKLGYNYLDTGAMYRGVAYFFISKGISVNDRRKVLEYLPEVDIRISYINGEQHVFLGSTDVTSFIRTPEISKGASDVAVIPEVRYKLVEIQRRTAEDFDIIMDGRDIGTFVLPDASAKFYLTADAEVRAQRRMKDLNEAGITKNFDELVNEIKSRDKTDMERSVAPLKQADDAYFIDSTNMSVEHVLNAIETVLREKGLI